MRRDTLVDFFDDLASIGGTFLIQDDGSRVRRMTYRDVAEAARRFAKDLATAGIHANDKVVIWAENSIEWVVAFWGAVIAGVVIVPVDFRVSEEYVRRIAGIVDAKAILVGEEVSTVENAGAKVWRLRDVISTSRAAHRDRGARSHTTDAGSEAAGAAAGEPQPPTPERTIAATDLAEILFTSGATAEPKGVTITHKNILANIVPIERGMQKYRKYERPFHPLRFLNLLPLSHMFGQSMATFIPPVLAGTVIFTRGYSPTEIVRQIKTRRVSVLVCVPKVLDVLADHVKRVSRTAAGPDLPAGTHWAKRWWHYRDVHRLFGWKFWCVVCGAAPLDPDLERFWRNIGVVVVQGYGLTETAPIVTLNHPLHASSGSVGRPLEGVEIKIADDGEILVRGDNVTSGYYKRAEETATAFADGWFHTGDIGELDSTGRLAIKGRKKEMIVTPQGLNVFPEDVERALDAQPGVKESAVVGVQVDGEERVHAVLVVEPGARVDAIVRAANATLEDHQRVWSTSVWPNPSLPRTEGTRKLKRRELQRWAAGETIGGTPAGGAATVESVVAQFAASRAITRETTMDELGLSSLDRVELMMALEDTFGVTIDEVSFSSAVTIADVKTLVRQGDGTVAAGAGRPSIGARLDGPFVPSDLAPPAAPIVFPSWNRSAFAHVIRRISLPTWILPLARVFLDLRVEGLEHLNGIDGPVIFAANHQSLMDAPAVLIALPAARRYLLAPAMAKEFFRAHFNRREFGWTAWFTNSLNYYLSAQFFNAFPLPQRETGARQTLRYIGEVASDGYSILIFPEGKRTEHGEIVPFRPGVGMMASRLNLPVIPVRLEGLDKVLHAKMRFPKRGPVRVAFGAPLRLSGDNYPALAKQVEDAVRAL